MLFTINPIIDPQPAAKLEPGQIPVRAAEPDLSTVAGCCIMLGVGADATLAEVVKAFRARAMLFHPDKTGHLDAQHQALAALEFNRARQAYETLTRQRPRPLVGIQWPEGLEPALSPAGYTTGDYERLARLNPVNPSIFYNLACHYFEDGRHAEAQAAFLRVLALNPNDEDAQYNLIISRLLSEIVLPGLGAGG